MEVKVTRISEHPSTIIRYNWGVAFTATVGDSIVTGTATNYARHYKQLDVSCQFGLKLKFDLPLIRKSKNYQEIRAKIILGIIELAEDNHKFTDFNTGLSL